MKYILITGGAGFIGSNFVHYVLEKYRDYVVVNLDLLTYAGNLENLKNLENNGNYKFIKGDIANGNLVTELFTDYNFDYVVNFAAESHVDRSIENPEVFIRTNVQGTQVLLDNACSQWMTGTDKNGYPEYKPGVKFLQISTDEVYGSLGSEGLFEETSPLDPSSPYSASKASADLLVSSYNKTYKLPVNISRCSNNYGPYQFPEKLIPLMIVNTLKGKKLPVYGDGQQIRDWIHVRDHCRALDMILHRGQSGQVYNIGGNNERANIDIVKLIIKKLGKSEELITFVKDRPGHDRRYAIDYSKLSTELGWEPEYSFERGIEKTINWYLDNKSWWEKIVKIYRKG